MLLVHFRRKRAVFFLTDSQRFLLCVEARKVLQQRFERILAVGALLQLRVQFSLFLVTILQLCLLVLECGKLFCKRSFLFSASSRFCCSIFSNFSLS